MSKLDETAGHAIGYGKPPAQYRFSKGQSGNPKGRPKKAAKKPEPPRFRDGRLDSLLEEEAFRSLRLNENGKPVEMSAVQAIMRSLLLEGVKGNRLAKKYAFEMLRQEGQDALQRSIDHYAHFARKKAEGEATIARCRKERVPPPRLFPHPDDILLDEAKLEVHLLGPLSRDEAIPFERVALVRDWFHARSVFEEKYGEVRTIECEGMSASASGVLAAIIDKTLPPSFQRNEGSTLAFLMDIHRLTKRQLGQRMQALMAQIANMPDDIEERLAARKRAGNAMDAVSEAFKKAAAGLAKGRGSADQTAPDPAKKNS